MSKQKKCPICGEINSEACNLNEKYFIFTQQANWICKNCGCSYRENDTINIKRGTKITKKYVNWLSSLINSKKYFFSSIFKMIEDIFKKELTEEQRDTIKALYDKRIKSYYKEVLLSQIDLFYELACNMNEVDFFKLLDKKSDKNKLT